MVAENFYSHQMDFFRPQVNLVGNAGDGVVGMELPIYNFAAAIAFRFWGFNHMWPRLLSVLSGVLALIGVWRLALFFGGDSRIALLSAWVFAWSPLVYFYSYKIQPDILGLALSVWGVLFFSVWRQKNKFIFCVLSWLCLALAGGIKPTFLSVGLPMLWIYGNESDPWRIWKRPELIIYGICVLVIPVAWMTHAKKLTESFGEAYFYLGENLLQELAGLLKWSFYQNVFLTWPIELALGVPAFVGIVIGVIIPRFRERVPKVVVPWLCGGGVVFILAAEHCATPHDYYYLVVVPPLSLIAAVGFFEMLQARKWRYLAMVLLISMPIYAIMRMEGRFSSSADIQALRGKVLALGWERSTLDNRSITPIFGPLTLAVDNVPGYLLYATGLRGFNMFPDGDPSYFDLYRRRGAKWILTRKSILESTGGLGPYLGKQILEDGEIVLFEVNET
jgi:hypothetical protein